MLVGSTVGDRIQVWWVTVILFFLSWWPSMVAKYGQVWWPSMVAKYGGQVKWPSKVCSATLSNSNICWSLFNDDIVPFIPLLLKTEIF